MQRISLNHGDTLEMNNRIYTIESVLGDGATCVVYSAVYKDAMGHSHRVNVKECYPYSADITRDGYELIWNDSEEKNESLRKFRESYEKLMQWQDANDFVSVFDVCELNNTQYIIMEPNKRSVTFDKDKPETLSDILKTIKLLAHYIGNYHQNGYLHLDIKPSNFLVYPRPSNHIILFDMDTVTAISDIESGNYKYFSYSDGWAAPEQKQGKTNKLCPATDIYAIGAVLFEKIMGRQVSNDDIGYFAEWSFDGDLFENVNPKIKRILSNIFKKTLAASVKRRYQTTDTLVKELDKAIKIAESEVYLKGYDICCSGYFVGREEELKKIKDSFDSKKKAVFLHGFGGIGKTEIARKYAEIYKKDYDVVLFVKYDNSSTLQEKLDEIDIEGFEGETVEKRKKLRALLDDKTLVIVDNFDVEIDADNGLKALLETKANVLVSTRTDFSSVYSGNKYIQIEILELASNELEQVFLSNAKIEIIKENEKDILCKIFKLIQNHTYATELLAKQMYFSGWSFETLYNKVKSGFSSFSGIERIVTNKDEDSIKDNSLNILRAVYRVSDLTEGQKQVLRNMSLLSFINITKKAFTDITECENLNDFNTLVELGYIQTSQGYFYLHTLMREIAVFELKPNGNTCPEIYDYIADCIDWFGEVGSDDEADKAEARYRACFLSGFFRVADLKDKKSFCMLLFWIRIMINSDFVISGSNWDKVKFDELLQLIEEKVGIHSDYEYDSYLSMFYMSTKLCEFDFKERIYNSKERVNRRALYFELLWNYCERTDNFKKMKELSVLVLREANQQKPLKFCHYLDKDSRMVAQIKKQSEYPFRGTLELVHNYNPKLFNIDDRGEYTYYGKFWYSPIYRDYVMANDKKSIIAIPQEIVKQMYFERYSIDEELIDIDLEGFFLDDLYKDLLNSYKEAQENRSVLDDYKTSINKKAWIELLIGNTTYTLEEKIENIDSILQDFFSVFATIAIWSDHTMEYELISNDEWDAIVFMINKQEELIVEYFNHSNGMENDKESLDYFSHLYIYSLCYKAIYYAYIDSDKFNEISQKLIEMTNTRKCAMLKNGIDTWEDVLTDYLSYACWNMHKCRYFVPVLRKQVQSLFDAYDVEDIEKYRRAQYGDFEKLYKFSIQALSEDISEIEKEFLEDTIKWSLNEMRNIKNEKYEIKDES